MSEVEHSRFLEKLEACERTGALLLLAMESGTPDPLKVLDQRKSLIDELSALLPTDLSRDELQRLQALLETGEQARTLALRRRLEATSNLATLQQSLRLARQLSPPRAPRQHTLKLEG
jgi:hypothetical protein